MLLIFTDLDGTLLNSEDYDFHAALPQLTALQTAQIPVIPVTSKTRSEVKQLRHAIGLTDPFIVENGSGVFVSQGDSRFRLTGHESAGDDVLLRLGCTYAEARAGLQAIAQSLGQPLQGFGDLSEAEIAQLTGLSLAEARQAQAREFSEPFITPQDLSPIQIKQAVTTQGFKVVVGDRFSHLIGPQAGKGRAVQQIVMAYQRAHPDVALITVGLGNSPNDLDLLEQVDHPIVIPGTKGPHPQLADRGWSIAPEPGCQGWAKAMETVRDRL